MAIIELAVQRRDAAAQLNRLRQQGLVPAIMYGHNIAPTTVQVERTNLDKAVRQGALTHLTTLKFEGQDVKVLIKELQRHPFKRNPLHVDFYQVSMTEAVEMEVSVRLVGALPNTVGSDYILVHNMEKVTVSCLPADIPDAITIDISSLTPEHHVLHIDALRVPANVKLMHDAAEIVVSLTRTRAAVSEDQEATATTAAEPEVVAKGKAAKGEELPPEESKKK